jgi:hypothetical protein
MHGQGRGATLLCRTRKSGCAGESWAQNQAFVSCAPWLAKSCIYAASTCLEVFSRVGIPDNFVLEVSYDKFSRGCHVIWRSDMRLGVSFSAPEWNYVGAMTGRPYLSCIRDVLASRDIP